MEGTKNNIIDSVNQILSEIRAECPESFEISINIKNCSWASDNIYDTNHEQMYRNIINKL